MTSCEILFVKCLKSECSPWPSPILSMSHDLKYAGGTVFPVHRCEWGPKRSGHLRGLCNSWVVMPGFTQAVGSRPWALHRYVPMYTASKMCHCIPATPSHSSHFIFIWFLLRWFVWTSECGKKENETWWERGELGCRVPGMPPRQPNFSEDWGGSRAEASCRPSQLVVLCHGRARGPRKADLGRFCQTSLIVQDRVEITSGHGLEFGHWLISLWGRAELPPLWILTFHGQLGEWVLDAIL